MILVTGGTGFLGAYIIRHLVEKGHAVRAIKRETSKLPFFIPPGILDQVQWLDGDILDIGSLDEAMEGVTAVIHSAAKVSFQKQDKDQMLHTNVEGTANMVNVALEKNIKRFIHISSVAALGRTAGGETVNEKKEWVEAHVNSNYGVSKYKAEMEVWRGMGEGLLPIIINPSTVLGYGDWNHSSCRLFKNAYSEFPWYTKGINGFVSVEDVAEAVVQLLQTDTVGERFIVSADNWSFQRLFDTMATGFGKRKPHLHATPVLGALAWRMEKLKSVLKGKPSLLSKESAAIAQNKTYFDNSKILKALPGFSFTPLDQVIVESCRKYREHFNG